MYNMPKWRVIIQFWKNLRINYRFCKDFIPEIYPFAFRPFIPLVLAGFSGKQKKYVVLSDLSVCGEL